MRDFNFIESRTYNDGTSSVFYEEDRNYFLEEFSVSGSLISSASAPYFDQNQTLTPIRDEQKKKTLGRTILNWAPPALMLLGLGTWAYLANQENAKAGILAFGVCTISGIGLSNWSKELSDRVELFNGELKRSGFEPLYLKK